MADLFKKIMSTEVDAKNRLPENVLNEANRIYEYELKPFLEVSFKNIDMLSKIEMHDYDISRVINTSNISKYDLDSLIMKGKSGIIGGINSFENYLKKLIMEDYKVEIKLESYDYNYMNEKDINLAIEEIRNYDYNLFLKKLSNELGDYETKSYNNHLNIFKDNRFYKDNIKIYKQKISFKNAIYIDVNNWGKYPKYNIKYYENDTSGVKNIFEAINFFFTEYYDAFPVSGDFFMWLRAKNLEDNVDLSKKYDCFPNVEYKIYKNGTVDVFFKTTEQCQNFVNVFGLENLKTLDEIRGW